MDYLVLKLVHLVAVVLFLGNTTTGVFWVAHAARTREPALLAHAMDGVIRSDRWFTVPGVLIIVLGGFCAAIAGDLRILRVGWIAWSLALFSFSGVVFSVWLVPLQRRILAYASGATGVSPDWDTCARMVRRWDVVGWLSLAPVWLALALMVLKLPR